jgi:hypothetical protein
VVRFASVDEIRDGRRPHVGGVQHLADDVECAPSSAPTGSAEPAPVTWPAPGRPIDVHVLVERATTRSSKRYGQIVCYELIDRNVNRLVWFQTRGAQLTAGQVVTLASRVRAHEQHGRSKLTVLSHCRITDPDLQ